MQLTLYGPLKAYGDARGEVSLDVPSPAPVRVVKAQLALAIAAAQALIQKSAFSDDERVLGDDEMLDPTQRYAVLPPVAGG